ncbi:hypothetical protein BVC80_3635g1 [Macleaya cordata]|uniref:Uncharacterized protein n=1 Tax=Macleaya cordata TaxID=56857 RepID=A0A200QRM5_MACCD|nr:hypothetical protein BVC80_3635g1 [Macleaya cordata]
MVTKSHLAFSFCFFIIVFNIALSASSDEDGEFTCPDELGYINGNQPMAVSPCFDFESCSALCDVLAKAAGSANGASGSACNTGQGIPSTTSVCKCCKGK